MNTENDLVELRDLQIWSLQPVNIGRSARDNLAEPFSLAANPWMPRRLMPCGRANGPGVGRLSGQAIAKRGADLQTVLAI